jgi:hypothetical protein
MRHRAHAVTAAILFASLFDGPGIHEAAAIEVTQFGDAGSLRVDYQIQARAGARDQGPDPTRAENTYDAYLRRNRLSFIGAANETFGAVVQLELNGGQRIGDVTVSDQRRSFELVLLDAFATADPFDFLRVRVGKTKHVLTREVQEGCFDPLSIDRSPFILGPFSAHEAEKTTRDVGLVVWGNIYEKIVQYRLAVMQGNRFGATPEGIGYRYTGRVHLTFFDQEPGIVYKGSYLGKKRVLTLGAGYERQPNAVYASGTTGAQAYSAYTADVFYEQPTPYGTFTASGAYLKADFGEAGIRGVADAQGVGGERNGFYWKAGYMLGPFQLYGRWENWSFAFLNGVVGQKLTWLVAGLNWFVDGEHLRFTLEGSTTRFDTGPATNFATILFQAQARF